MKSMLLNLEWNVCFIIKKKTDEALITAIEGQQLFVNEISIFFCQAIINYFNNKFNGINHIPTKYIR